MTLAHAVALKKALAVLGTQYAVLRDSTFKPHRTPLLTTHLLKGARK